MREIRKDAHFLAKEQLKERVDRLVYNICIIYRYVLKMQMGFEDADAFTFSATYHSGVG